MKFSQSMIQTVKLQGARSALAPALRWGEWTRRYPSTTRGMLSIADQAIVSGTGFLTAVIVGRNLPTEQLGLYYLTLSIVLFLAGIQEALIAAPYTIFSSRQSGEELAEYTGSTWMHHFALTGAAVAFIGLLITVLSLRGSTTALPGLWALLGAAPLLLLREAVRRFSFARLELRVALGIDLAVCVLQLGGLAFLAYSDRLSVFNVFAVMATACAVASLGWFVLEPRNARFAPRRFYSDWRVNWSFAQWALFGFVVGTTTSTFMPWIVEGFADASATGILGGCTTLINICNVAILGAHNYLSPKAAHAFAQEGNPGLRRVLLAASLFFVVFIGALCLLLLLTGDRIAVWIYGPAFTGSGTVLLLLAANMLIGSLGMAANIGLWAIERPRASLPGDLVLCLTTLAMAFLLVSPFRALGAALAMLIGTTLGASTKIITLRAVMRPDPSPLSGVAAT